MTKFKYAILLAAVAMAVALTGSACTNSNANEKPETAATTGATKPAAKPVDDKDKPLKYSQCMRQHGVAEFPDPVNGRLQLQLRPGTGLDPQNPTFKAAEQACKEFAPSGTNAKGGGQEMLEFAQCMRKNGVTKFPDPQDGGKMLMGPDSGVDPNSPQFKAAMQACRDLMPGGLPAGGQ